MRRIGGRQLRRYRQRAEQWHAKHPLGFDTTNINVRRIYVPLQSAMGTERADMSETLRTSSRVVVLGEPGAGKSLLLKTEILRWLEKGDDDQVPVIVALHKCNFSRDSLRDFIVAEFTQANVSGAAPLVDRMLSAGRMRVFFDGLDEVGRDDRERVERDLRDFARTHAECPMVVTCRTAVYDSQLSPDFDFVTRIAEFDDASMRRFLNNWNKAEDSLNVDRVVTSLRSNRDLMRIARRPLLLTIIAYLQSGDRVEAFGPLPNSRAEFYRSAIAHLLDRDRQLGRRSAISNYNGSRKLLILQRIALGMHEAPVEREDRLAVSGESVESIIRTLLPDFDLGSDHVLPLLEEIVDRSQLLRPLDRLRSQYGFAHLTLQEFLTAQALHESPSDLRVKYHGDPNAWREVVKFWCAVASVDCTSLISSVFREGGFDGKILALESLSDTTFVDARLAEEIISYFLMRLGSDGYEGTAIANALGALAANNTPRGNETLELLRRISWEPPSERQAAAVLALAASDRQEAASHLAALEQDEERRAGARAALRSMGEIAIPQLARGARGRQEIWAIDALGRIGTPSAAIELASLLWLDSSAARRAAWLLSSLIRIPDVEEALRECEAPEVSDSYAWIWDSAERSRALRIIAARIGFLLDAGHLLGCVDHLDGCLPTPPIADEPIEVRMIDPRIGAPIAALGIERHRYNQDSIPRHLRIGRAIFDWGHAYGWVSGLNGQIRRDQLLEVFRKHRHLPNIYRRLSHLLPREVENLIIARLVMAKDPASPLTKELWQAAHTAPPRPPVVLEKSLKCAKFGALSVLYVVASLRALSTVFSYHLQWVSPMKDPWASAAGFASLTFLVSSVALLGLALYDRGLDYWSESVEILMGLVWLFFIPCYLFLSLELAIAWMGWEVVLISLASTVAFVLVGYWNVNRKVRDLANPFRRMLSVQLGDDGLTSSWASRTQ
ncbi:MULTISPECIES: NACHT domain-containing NTPase [unclassified Streptomyces]|uniref:NACHT domain-containing protein n=1 Tax=unclassified Streptomyces TaxID=2593676 RepID=UPI00131EF18D|nr:NACHT domain-containing protein [Streptomyces sp. 303MFCol5.2]